MSQRKFSNLKSGVKTSKSKFRIDQLSSDDGLGIGSRDSGSINSQRRSAPREHRGVRMGPVDKDMKALLKQQKAAAKAAKPKKKKEKLWDQWEVFKRGYFAIAFALLSLYVVYTGLLGLMVYTVVFACRAVHVMAGVFVAFGWLAAVLFITMFSTYMNRKRLGAALPWVPVLTFVGLAILFGVGIPCGKGLAKHDYVINREAAVPQVYATDEAFPYLPSPSNTPYRLVDSKVADQFAKSASASEVSKVQCVAPIVSTRGRKPYTVNYWVVGTDCCYGHNIYCPGWDEKLGEGILKASIKYSKDEMFLQAKKQALKKSGGDLKDAKGSVFVQWSASEVPDAQEIYRDCMAVIYGLVFGWPVVLGSLVALVGASYKGGKEVVKKAKEVHNRRRVRYVKVQNEEQLKALQAKGYRVVRRPSTDKTRETREQLAAHSIQDMDTPDYARSKKQDKSAVDAASQKVRQRKARKAD